MSFWDTLKGAANFLSPATLLLNGLGGKDGQSAAMASASNPALDQLNQQTNGSNSSAIQGLVGSYGTGGESLADALKSAEGMNPNQDQIASLTQQRDAMLADPEKYGGQGAVYDKMQQLNQQIGQLQSSGQGQGYSAAVRALASDPLAGSRMAAEEVQNNPLTSGLFGKGGIQDQAQGQYGQLQGNLDQDRQALMGKDESYGLNENDLAAYGQTAGNIARMFGQSGNNLAQSLADRGLGAAPSGAAAAEFSGLNGNKNEQLAQAQMQIMQNRINTAKGLAEFRTQTDADRAAKNASLMEGLGQIGQEALQNQYGRQMVGVEDQYNRTAGTAGMNMQNQNLQQNINNEQFSQNQQTKKPGMLDQTMDAINAAPGQFIGSFAGKAGQGLASAL